MKKTNILSLLLVLFGFALVTGCTPDTDTPDVPEETTYTVTYSSEYGRAPASITVTENTVLTAEQLPDLSTEGKTFDGWFDGDTKAEAGKYKVTKTVTLTAKWDENTPEPAPEDDSNNDDENQEGSEETTPTETESEDPPVVDEPEEHPENTETDDNPTTETDNGESEESEDTENNETEEPENTTETPEGTDEESGNDDQNTENSESEVIIPAGTEIKLLFYTPDESGNYVEDEGIEDDYDLLTRYIDTNHEVSSNGLSLDDIKFYGQILVGGADYLTFLNNNNNMLGWYYSLENVIRNNDNSITLKYYYQENN